MFRLIIPIMLFGLISPNYKPIHSQEDFVHQFKTRKMFSVMLDLRTEVEYEGGHLKRAVHMPMGEDMAGRILEKLKTYKTQNDVLLFVYGGEEKWLEEFTRQTRKSWAFRRRVNAVFYLSKPYTQT